MNSRSTGRTNNVQYNKLEIDDDQAEAAPDTTLGVASSSSIGGANEVSELRPFRSSGYNCLGCIPLRAGIMLLSVENGLDAARKFSHLASVLQIKRLTTEYNMNCKVRVLERKAYCGTLRQRIFEKERKTIPIPEVLHSVVFIVAALQVFFAVVGVVAASTKNPKAARLFMVAYWMASVYEITIGVVLCINIGSDLRLGVLLFFIVFLVYFYQVMTFYSYVLELLIAQSLKVASLFHKKCSLEEAGRLAIGIPLEVEDVSRSNTPTPTAV